MALPPLRTRGEDSDPGGGEKCGLTPGSCSHHPQRFSPGSSPPAAAGVCLLGLPTNGAHARHKHPTPLPALWTAKYLQLF